MNKLLFLPAWVCTFLMGCSSLPYTYHQNPIPLKRCESLYAIKAPAVNLSLGNGAIPGDTSFVNQDILAQQFNNSLIESFTANKIYTASEADADAVVEIVMDYTRTFNDGGKSLNRPQFSYSVAVKKGGQLLASYAIPASTTHYGFIKDMAVCMEISEFKWGAEDESQDVALIAKTIASEVAAMGK